MLFIKLLVTMFLTCSTLYLLLLIVYTLLDLHHYYWSERVLLLCAFLAVTSAGVLMGLVIGHMLFLIWTT